MRAKPCPYAPECASRSELTTRWGQGIVEKDSYEEDECCRIHSCIRTHLPRVFSALKRHGFDAWLVYGSALGQIRHNGTQIPWDRDADLAVMVANKSIAEHGRLIRGLKQVADDLPGMEFFDRNLWMSCWQFMFCVNIPGLNKSCAESHVIQRPRRPREPGPLLCQIDIFGMTYMDKPPKVIQGQERRSVDNIGKCYHNHRTNDSQSYYTHPAVDCPFYDKTVRCPRDTKQYVTEFYGPNALTQSMPHDEAVALAKIAKSQPWHSSAGLFGRGAKTAARTVFEPVNAVLVMFLLVLLPVIIVMRMVNSTSKHAHKKSRIEVGDSLAQNDDALCMHEGERCQVTGPSQ